MSDGPHDDDERRRLACLHTQLVTSAKTRPPRFFLVLQTIRPSYPVSRRRLHDWACVTATGCASR